MKSDVYFIKTTGNDIENRKSSLLKLIKTIEPILAYKNNDIVPIKLTLGDTKCINNIKPELVKTIVYEIKKRGAKPFLFDTNVIYKGSRGNAIDHLTLAQNKGFAQSRTGAPFIIADGILGQDGKEYDMDSRYLKNIKIPSFIGTVENLIALSHITGHVLTGYAGAIKNIGMGMVSKPTKQTIHSSLKPHIIEKKCTACENCINICPVRAISLLNGKCHIDKEKCIGCGECLCVCNFDAIFINWHEDIDKFMEKLIDAVAFIISRFKNKMFLNFAFDMTKECDCISAKNEEILYYDIGIFASQDILSIEKATIDYLNKCKKSHLNNMDKIMIEYAHKKNLGNIDYNLINLS